MEQWMANHKPEWFLLEVQGVPHVWFEKETCKFSAAHVSKDFFDKSTISHIFEGA